MEHTIELDQPEASHLSPRARAIAHGLRRTGRTGDLRAALSSLDRETRCIILPAMSDLYYFLAADGAELLRGDDFMSAELLQPGFVASMARIGGYTIGVVTAV